MVWWGMDGGRNKRWMGTKMVFPFGLHLNSFPCMWHAAAFGMTGYDMVGMEGDISHYNHKANKAFVVQ